jgi:hypothetical protein
MKDFVLHLFNSASNVVVRIQLIGGGMVQGQIWNYCKDDDVVEIRHPVELRDVSFVSVNAIASISPLNNASG